METLSEEETARGPRDSTAAGSSEPVVSMASEREAPSRVPARARTSATLLSGPQSAGAQRLVGALSASRAATKHLPPRSPDAFGARRPGAAAAAQRERATRGVRGGHSPESPLPRRGRRTTARLRP